MLRRHYRPRSKGKRGKRAQGQLEIRREVPGQEPSSKEDQTAAMRPWSMEEARRENSFPSLLAPPDSHPLFMPALNLIKVRGQGRQVIMPLGHG